MIKNKIRKFELSTNISLGSSLNLVKFFAVVFSFMCAGIMAHAQTAMVTNNFVSYGSTATTIQCQLDVNQGSLVTNLADLKANDKSFYTGATTPTNNSSDPWVKSALIEYDQPYPTATPVKQYPNHCLTLCAEVTCSNPVRKVNGPEGSTTTMMEASGEFPIQSILFEVFKYQKNGNPYNPDSTPPIKTIAMYPDGTNIKNICRGVGAHQDWDNGTLKSSTSCCDNCWPEGTGCVPNCTGKTQAQCTSAAYSGQCRWAFGVSPLGFACRNRTDNTCGGATTSATCTGSSATVAAGCRWGSGRSADPNCSGKGSACKTTFANYNTGDVEADYADCSAGITRLYFCAPWDGMYEVDGEHAKTNGHYGYRSTISSQWPGDGVSTPDIDLSHTIVYPGDSQVPIQVDVTNIHTVRSTATLVGARVAVSAQPYNISYRLSKDSDVNIMIKDANSATVHRNLINWQPRLGEGTPGGTESYDTVTTEVEGWDGRDNNGRLLPPGNYVVSLQGRSNDEWTGTTVANADISRAVTRQISLDSLKLTDFVTTPLNKNSTSYAMLAYMVTESATVHVEIYTPGTSFANLNIAGDVTNTTAPNFRNIAVAPAVANSTGYKVASYTEQKNGRVNVNTKWDGRCWDETNCTGTAGRPTLGAPLADGDYVYLIWAEVPYGGTDTVSVNGLTWNGAKTNRIYNGLLPISRGLPDITIQPVGYSTIGSSPAAFGLDPFIMRFSLSRDSIVTAKIKTSAEGGGAGAPFTVKTLFENQVKVANQMNVETWDGKDENGRFVSQGTYMLEIEAKDALFPNDKSTISTVLFPVDIFRIVDVGVSPIVGDATSQAMIDYMLSKSMHVTIDIYEPGVVIPNPHDVASWPPPLCPVGAPANNCIHTETGTTTPLLVKQFVGTRPGEGVSITEFWDGLFSTSPSATQDVLADGMYPYLIYGEAQVPGATYYIKDTLDNWIPVDGSLAANQTNSVKASDNPTGYITVARGPVYFTHLLIKPSSPQLFYSSETILIPTYEVQFAVTRTANVTVEIRSNSTGACLGPLTPPGTVCRTLTKTMSTQNSTIYDPIVTHKLYWDGKDEKGEYVKKDAYEVRFSADPYPPTTPPQETTVRSEFLNVNNFQVFDRYIWDVTGDNKGMGKFAYQISVPMKVAIQIFKPGTKINDPEDGTLLDPATGNVISESLTEQVLVKAIVGVRPHLVAIEDVWDGTDFAGQKVPDGIYPFRYVTVLDSYDMDSITGAVKATGTYTDPTYASTVQGLVGDWDKFINLGVINVANGDSWYADLDWKSNQVTMFFPNPLRQSEGHFEITKVPAPGTVSIKIYNIAGDLVRDGGYLCRNARGDNATLEQINNDGGIQPDWSTNSGSQVAAGTRNYALRCTWDKTNNHGKPVARGLYYAIMELNPTRGNAKKSQKVIKILIP